MVASIKRCGWPVVAALQLAMPAHAEEGIVDQVELLEMEAGETELEGLFILGHDGGESELIVSTTLEHAVTDRLQFGIEVEGERETGASLVVEGISLQLKWIAHEAAGGRFRLGVQPALHLDPSSGRIGSETLLIAQARSGPLAAAANLVVTTAPGRWNEAATAYAARAEREVGDRLTVGFEAGGALSGEGAGSHFAGPSLRANPGRGLPSFELAAFAPLSSAAPGWQLRLETDWEF